MKGVISYEIPSFLPHNAVLMLCSPSPFQTYASSLPRTSEGQNIQESFRRVDTLGAPRLTPPQQL